MNNELDEMKAWLKLNREHFLAMGYCPDEVAYFAHMNGFSPKMVSEVLSHFQDAIQGSNFDNKAKMWLNCETSAIERLSNPFSLRERWFELQQYENGKEFKETL